MLGHLCISGCYVCMWHGDEVDDDEDNDDDDDNITATEISP